MTKQTSKSNGSSSKAEFRGFFNPVLNADIKTAVKELDLKPASTAGRLFELVSAGFKVTIRADEANTHLSLSLFDMRVKSDSAGYIMTVKHADMGTVVGLAWLLVFEIYEGRGWLAWMTPTNDIEW